MRINEGVGDGEPSNSMINVVRQVSSSVANATTSWRTMLNRCVGLPIFSVWI